MIISTIKEAIINIEMTGIILEAEDIEEEMIIGEARNIII